MPDGYRMYAGSPADFTGSGQVGGVLTIERGTLTVWSGLTGDNRVADLLDVAEAPASTVTSDDFGNFRFWAPDELGSLFVSADGGLTRYAVQPADLADEVKTLRTDMDAALDQVAQAETTSGAQAKASAAQQAAEDYADTQLAPVAAAASAALRVPAGIGPRVWTRTIAQGLPTAGEGAQDGDYAFLG